MVLMKGPIFSYPDLMALRRPVVVQLPDIEILDEDLKRRYQRELRLLNGGLLSLGHEIVISLL